MQHPLLHIRRFLQFHRIQALLLIGIFLVFGLTITGPQPTYAQTPVNCADEATTGVPQAECEALVTLYTSTDGPNWITSTNWNTATAVGTWYGVTVSGGHVTALVLEENRVSGTMSSLSDLTQLQTLDLSTNCLGGGGIPNLSALTQLRTLDLSSNCWEGGGIPDLSALTQLQTLDLSYIGLGGSIPNLSALTQLQTLDLSFSGLGGSIPDLSALTQLQSLDLSVNLLSGSIPNLSALTQLQHLYLYSNQLSGGIPDPSALTQLQVLDLSFNQLSGSIPNLSALTQLQYLDLRNNQLSDGIPDLSALTQLQTLDLSNNQLSGSIPDLSALTQLQTLNLSVNALSGSIPSLSGLTQLQTLSLVYNQLSGSIPDLSALTQLQYLYLNTNQLSGSIPDLSALTQLQHLDLRNNQLVSLIPLSITSTAISGNYLLLCESGNIIASPDPAIVAWVQARDVLWTQGCGMGAAPTAAADSTYTAPANTTFTVGAPGVMANDTLGTPGGMITFFGGGSLGGMVTAYAAGTSVSPLPGHSNGSLQVNADGSFVFTPPTGFTGDYTFEYRLNNGVGVSDALVSIRTILNCADTVTTGVPEAECEALVALYNSTNGPGWTNKANWNTATAVSTWFGVTVDTGHVKNLSLSNNRLSGSIPDLSGLTQLQWLNLSNNQLSGSIPNLSGLTQLQLLNLSNNQLSGSIPSLSGLTQLHGVGLSTNQLTGSIPDLSGLTQLQALHVDSNQLVSLIPPSITGTAITGSSNLILCGGNNIIASNNPTVTAWVQARNSGWTQGCGLGTGPSAVADPDYTTLATTTLTVDAPGVLTNDSFGIPGGTVTFFGVLAADQAIGTTISPLPGHSNGSLLVNADGSFVFTPPTGFTGDYTFEYRLNNGVGVSDAMVSVEVVALPSLSVTNASGFESNTATMTFTVRRTGNTSITSTVAYTTANGTATAGSDYVAKRGTLTFASGVLTKQIVIKLRGDSVVEGNEFFFVNLSNPTGAIITDYQGQSFIRNSTPRLIRPSNNSISIDSTPTFTWLTVAGAAQYRLQVDNNANFASPVINMLLIGNYTPRVSLSDTRYHWRVQARDAAGNWGGWSPRWSFVVNAVPLAQPTLIPTNTPRPTRTPQPTATVVPTVIPTATPPATVVVPLLQLVESDQSLVLKSGLWTAYDEPSTSGGRYLLSSTLTDTLTMAFVGSEVTVVYIKHPAVGSFAIEIDGVVMQLVDSVAAEAVFGAEVTIPGLVYGQHTVRVSPVAGVVAIDAFRVETALEVVVPTETPLPTDLPTDVPTDVLTETPVPTDIPTDVPTDIPTETPVPTDIPTDVPTDTPIPTGIPTDVPTQTPVPTEAPTVTPVPTEVPAEVLPPVQSTEDPAS